MDLNTAVAALRFVGPIYARRLEKLGIYSIKDLLYHFPFRYDDLSHLSPIADTVDGELVTIQGNIWQIKNLRTRAGKFMTTAVVNDGSASIDAVWFNQPYLTKTLKTNIKVNLSGKVGLFKGRLSLVSPDFEVIKEGSGSIHTARLVPIYPETYGVSSKWLRSRIKPLLDSFSGELKEFLPEQIVETNKLIPRNVALRQIHFPNNLSESNEARQRFSFEEMFVIQLRALIKKNEWQKQKVGLKFKVNQKDIDNFTASLPFELTNSQKKVNQEILGDLIKSSPMNRLLEGDVGSGKTVVAALAIYLCYLNGYKSALMAPTEILAKQHYQTLDRLLSGLGMKILLQTGSTKMIRKESKFDCAVGTHALLTEKLNLNDLGLIVIDEQHRFGVEQRAILRSRGKPAHFLTMTATPIPRTMALTIFGDLDLSVIDEMPKGRKIIKTYLVPPEKRDSSYRFIKEHVKNGEQVFIIAPFIEPSETLSTIRAVNTEYKRLSEEVFEDLKIGLLHGKLKSKEKDDILKRFRDREFDILVSTPVVEVGIDIPGATIMMIEGADRFGLAQIHQLRGRVGRNDLESFCLLFTDNPSPEILSRLKLLERLQIGMGIAEADLHFRGPGDVYGIVQSGLPNLKIASFNDVGLINDTHKSAQAFLEKENDLTNFPNLELELTDLNQKIAPD